MKDENNEENNNGNFCLDDIMLWLIVLLTNICYLDIQNTDVGIIFSFSLYTVSLLVALVTISEKILKMSGRQVY